MEAQVFDHELFDYALMKPLFSRKRPNTLRIVSGYASYALASRHLLAVNAAKSSLAVDLVYGMAGVEGVKKGLFVHKYGSRAAA